LIVCLLYIGEESIGRQRLIKSVSEYKHPVVVRQHCERKQQRKSDMEGGDGPMSWTVRWRQEGIAQSELALQDKPVHDYRKDCGRTEPGFRIYSDLIECGLVSPA
jgi:hypothetical protein